ncbi:MAG: UDP-N-acetylglucosamine 1-carboxyvinyltransferase [Oscillospiraceae bacterium]|nr:UDP-N-acetylglucosamine 1-carboxyvinyltransferase [Oscillospiraceae bacterium]
MERYEITGGNRLSGDIVVSGAKNAAVAIIAAAVMVSDVSVIENIPGIVDVEKLYAIVGSLGVRVRKLTCTSVELDCRDIRSFFANCPEMGELRASYYMLGALLGRFGYAKIAMPGGCNFGIRPIDQHVKGLEALGAKVSIGGGYITAEADKLTGARISLDVVTVGATINIMLAATMAVGQTIIENAAQEPHIVDLANFLNACGAKIRGAGTNTIRITGVSQLEGRTYAIIPDQIEAGTYLAAVTGTGGDVVIRNVIPRHLMCITSKLIEMGAEVEDLGDAVRIKRLEPLRRANVRTMPYPGFPTDMQPQITALLCLARGTSIVTEGVWDDRFRYVDQLARMGAHITVKDGRTAVIEGSGRLEAAPLIATDLRAGAAMVIAGLCAKGTTYIEEIRFIERGYEDMVNKLRGLGADISGAGVAAEPIIEQYIRIA